MLKVVVVDTGIDKMYRNENVIGGVTVVDKEEGYCVVEGCEDAIGHGTGTVDIILRNTNNVKVFMVKIYDNDIYIPVEKLNFALEYIKQNIDFDIIQVSSGVNVYSGQMHGIVKDIINEKGKCIISAFDNEGGISYPAAFEEVIGVDTNHAYTKKEEFDVIINNIIDIRGGSAFFRMAYLGGRNNILKGSSFLTSYITAIIANMDLVSLEKQDILKQLGTKAKQVIVNESAGRMTAKEFVSQIKKVIVFPFNKEIHSIAKFEELLPFSVSKYYDIKHKFLVGRRINDILPHIENQKEIFNYDTIDWNDDFDAIICGHVGEISKIVGRNFIVEIIQKCMEYNKKAYFFDNLAEMFSDYSNSSQFYCPYIESGNVLENRFGKLRLVNKPVLAVMGTSSKQGKFTIQLSILKEMRKRDFVIDGIGTEPSSVFFGYSQQFPFGYGSGNSLSNEEMVRTLNEMIWEVEKGDVDLILTGCQSGTVSYDLRNEALLLVGQYNFMLGTNPDSVVLCVNEIDDIEYVKRTINFIEAAGNAKVIAIIMSQTHKLFSDSILYVGETSRNVLTSEQLKREFERPVFLLSDLDIEKLVDVIIEYYQ